MKKIILFLILQISILNAQEVDKIYLFKKEKLPSKNFIFHCMESDSLILYKDNSYKRFYNFQCHEINYIEQKGDWKVENKKLYLKGKENNESKTKKSWYKINNNYVFQIKYNKIKLFYKDQPFNAFLNAFYDEKKLKLLKIK